MSSIRIAVEIDADPATIWSVVEPIEDHVEWMADAATIDFAGEQTRGVGTAFTCLTKIGPISLEDHMEITVWEPEQRMGVRHSGVVTGTGVFELSPIDEHRTTFSWSEQLSFPWYLGGRLGELVGGRLVLTPIWRRNLRTLKALVEQR